MCSSDLEHFLTDLVFIDRGRIILDASMESVGQRFHELVTTPEHSGAALALKPVSRREVLGRPVYLYDGTDPAELAKLGEVRTPSVADLFVAKVSGGLS